MKDRFADKNKHKKKVSGKDITQNFTLLFKSCFADIHLLG